jgi:Ca2+-binding RTX toxin-like protein
VDARHLEFQEAFFGQNFFQNGGANPRPNSGPIVEEIWDSLYAELSARLLLQGPLAEAFHGIALDTFNDRFYLEEGFDSNAVFSSAISTMAANTPVDVGEVAPYWDVMVSVIDVMSPPLGFEIGAFDTELQQVFSSAGYGFTPGALRDGSVFLGYDGNDIIVGGVAGDTYTFGVGYGQDRIADTGSGTDILDFTAEITPSNITHFRAGTDANDLVFDVVGTEDRLLFLDQFDVDDYGVEEVRFADGTVWTLADIKLALLTASTGDDDLIGYETDDTLDGGLGSDYLEGRGGGDTYSFDAGYGIDWITEAGSTGVDTVLFGAGILVNDIEVHRNGLNDNDLVLQFNNPDDQLTVEQQFANTGLGIEEFRFDDGTVWTNADLRQLYLDRITTAGDDILNGFDGADTLTGGLGNDTLHGGLGSDTYVFTRGDGIDEIEDNGSQSTDRLLIHGYTPAEVTRLEAETAIARRLMQDDGTAPWTTFPKAIEETADMIAVAEGAERALLEDLRDYLVQKADEAAALLA